MHNLEVSVKAERQRKKPHLKKPTLQKSTAQSLLLALTREPQCNYKKVSYAYTSWKGIISLVCGFGFVNQLILISEQKVCRKVDQLGSGQQIHEVAVIFSQYRLIIN